MKRSAAASASSYPRTLRTAAVSGSGGLAAAPVVVHPTVAAEVATAVVRHAASASHGAKAWAVVPAQLPTTEVEAPVPESTQIGCMSLFSWDERPQSGEPTSRAMPGLYRRAMSGNDIGVGVEGLVMMETRGTLVTGAVSILIMRIFL